MANPDISEARTRLDESSANDEARRIAEDRATWEPLIWEWVYRQDIAAAKRRGREEGLREGRQEGREEGLRLAREEARIQGLRDGRQEVLRDAVRTACEILGIELTDDRNAKLQGGSLEEIESLLAALRRNREWPG